jgi:hypothetical protein
LPIAVDGLREPSLLVERTRSSERLVAAVHYG